jgi:DMSO/TMAO reductase YedYZ molybdopterin-dependent catalytic subunit
MRMRRVRFLSLLATTSLAGCAGIATSLNDNPTFHKILETPERLDLALLGSGQPLAREYRESDISPMFRQNGFLPPSDAQYLDWTRDGWRGYRLFVGGLVDAPRSYDLAALRARFDRVSQITRHDCVEGWSVIGKWTGARLRDVLADVAPRPEARYVVFHCMDDDGTGTKYFESLDLRQAAHPQALLAYDLNDRPVPIENGAPLRLKVPTQLGYKSAKYVNRIELVAALGGGLGEGGYWENDGYEWYAGI